MPITKTNGAVEKVLSFIRQAAALPEAELEWLAIEAQHRSYVRREAFCNIGQVHHEFAFIEQGIFKVQTVTSSGEDVVLDIMFPGDFLLALDSAIQNVACEVRIEALTPAKILVWPYDLRLTAFARHDGWRSFERILTERAFIRKNKLYHLLRTRSSKERILEIESELPPSWVDIPRGVLASYFGITPQFLSKIHRR